MRSEGLAAIRWSRSRFSSASGGLSETASGCVDAGAGAPVLAPGTAAVESVCVVFGSEAAVAGSTLEFDVVSANTATSTNTNPTTAINPSFNKERPDPEPVRAALFELAQAKIDLGVWPSCCTVSSSSSASAVSESTPLADAVDSIPGSGELPNSNSTYLANL